VKLMQRDRSALVALSLILGASALRGACADSVDWQQIGKAGEWANTAKALALHGRLWTLDARGTLAYETLDGKRAQVGNDAAFPGARMWISLGANLYIVVGGTMYGGDPEHGPWRMVCDPEWWADTKLMINTNGYIWSIDRAGRFFRTNTSCISDQMGSDAIDATMLAAMGGKLWAIDGTGLNVHAADEGTWESVDIDDYGDTDLFVGSADDLWLLRSDGSLFRVRADSWRSVGAKGEFHDVKFLFFVDGSLYVVRDGTLYKRKA